MATKYTINDTTLTQIADPLRSLSGETGAMTPAEMADAGESAVAEVDIQTELMGQIQAALESKAGSGGINPSGTLNITENGSYDVANYASAEVNVPPEGCNHTTVTQATPSITVSSSGLITAKATQSAGLVSAGTKSATKQLTTQGAKTVTPSTSEQVAVSAGTYVTGDIKVAAVSGGDSGGSSDAEQALIDLIERDIVLTSLPDNLTKIGRYAFAGCTNITLTSLPDGITSIGLGAFRDCSKLALTSLPASLTKIENYTFYLCAKLALTSLPPNITYIGSYAFTGCDLLSAVEIPVGVTGIDGYAFQACDGLGEVTFKGTPSGTVARTIFSNCTALTTINVPWAEGAIANAPWGATNATINYNYAG